MKALAPDTPIEGRIVFTKRAKFPKGLPRFTVMLESVAAEFPKLGAAELEIAVSKYRPGWERIKGSLQAQPALPHEPDRRRVVPVPGRETGKTRAGPSLRSFPGFPTRHPFTASPPRSN